MSHEVYANGRCIASKSGSGTSPAAFPDTCFTPPQTPATPPGAPVPYPNTASESDTSEGSRSVLIVGKEVMLKNQSYYASSTGDEAGCAPQKGVVSTVNRGKCYFVAWSMDVVFEGLEVCRHLDLTTHNHASPTANTPPFPNLSGLYKKFPDCGPIIDKIHPYGEADCPSGSQSHHIIDNACLTMRGARKVALKNLEDGAETGPAARNLFQPGEGCHPGEGYSEDNAPCICLRGGKSNPRTQHGKAHEFTDAAANRVAGTTGKWSYQQARNEGADSIQVALKLTDFETNCIKLVLDAYYKKQLGFTNTTEMDAPTGRASPATTYANGHGGNCAGFGLVDA